jgi:anion-transporting  ArsA/GET3 family ATPase
MTARLHVLLGAGGVGKTTLAAAYAIALAGQGRRVGLLGIDPARRLQGALGLMLTDREAPVPGAGELRAALLRPDECLRRWAVEACGPSEVAGDREARARLLRNPFFVALADRLATSTDVLAAVRVAEWVDADPAMTDLVVDTAPGLNAIEFLRRPRSLATFLEGPLVRWLRAIARVPSAASPFGAHVLADVLRGGARRALGGLARLGGSELLLDLADFLASVEGMLEQMLARAARVQALLPRAEILLVTTVRDDAAVAARALAEALAAAGLHPRAAVLNRAMPSTLAAELAAAQVPAAAEPLVRYATAYAAIQRRVIEATRPLAPFVVVVPGVLGLDAGGRFAGLRTLGDRLVTELAAAEGASHAERDPESA